MKTNSLIPKPSVFILNIRVGKPIYPSTFVFMNCALCTLTLNTHAKILWSSCEVHKKFEAINFLDLLNSVNCETISIFYVCKQTFS